MQILHSPEREMIGNFLLKMAEKQVISARSAWYVDKRALRREFDQYLQMDPNGVELRNKLSINGAFNVSNSKNNYSLYSLYYLKI